MICGLMQDNVIVAAAVQNVIVVLCHVLYASAQRVIQGILEWDV